MLLCVCSVNWSQITPKCGKCKTVPYESLGEIVTDGNRATWNLLVYISKEPKIVHDAICFSVLHNRLWGGTNQNTRIIWHIVITWHIIETFNSLIRFCTGICFFYRVTIRCLTAYLILGFMVLRFPHFRFHFCFLLKTSSMFFFLWETACKNCISQTLCAYFVYIVDDVLIKKRN